MIGCHGDSLMHPRLASISLKMSSIPPAFTSQALRWPFWPPCVAHKDFWEHKSWGHSPDSAWWQLVLLPVASLTNQSLGEGFLLGIQILGFALLLFTQVHLILFVFTIPTFITSSLLLLYPNVMLCKNALHLFVLYTRENRYTWASRSQFSSSTMVRVPGIEPSSADLAASAFIHEPFCLPKVVMVSKLLFLLGPVLVLPYTI